MDVSQQYIIYGVDKIPFELQPRNNNANKVLIKVQPDCNVIVLAPQSASIDEIFVAVNKRARWVHSKLEEFKAQREQTTPRQYVSGESHYYLGKKYILKVTNNPHEKQNTKLLRGKLEITAQDPDQQKVKTLLINWYKEKAGEVFNRRLDILLSKTLWVTTRPDIYLKSMQTQWGNCSPTGKLTLNPHLVKAPHECIDYVILHELCHIAEHNHSEKFYRILTQVVPNWEKIKLYLDSKASAYL